MYRFVYSLRLLLWWLAVAMPLGAYAGDDTRSEVVEVLTISEDISISSNHISKGVSDIVTLDKGLFRSQVAFDLISVYSTWRHPHSSDRIQTSGDIAVRFIGGNGSYYDSSPQASIRDASKATFNSFVQGDVGNELLKLTPPLFNGDQGKQFLFRQDFEQDYNTLMRILDDGIPGGKVAAWEKFVDDGLPPSFRKNILNLKQRTILDDWTVNISSATNKQKGNFGEIGADLDLNAKGYESLMHTRIDNINAAGHDGLDGVYKKNGVYFVIEGKYTGSASLNPADPATGLPRQMSDDWIATRDWSEVNLDQSVIDDIINNTNYQRVLAKVAPEGTVTYRLIDSDGYAILGNTGVWTP